jgi:SNF2 family DNA or RNA helicase
MVAFPTDQLMLSAKHPVGILGWRQDVANLLPHAKEGVLDGERVLVLPHSRDEAKLLANLGIAVPPPILWRYDWCGTTPFEAQRATAALLTTENNAFVLNEMATGKTRACLFAFDFLKSEGAVDTMLVACPLSTLRDTWQREIARYFPHLRAVVVHGTAEQRKLLLKEPADIFLINHDGVRAFSALLAARDFDVVCVDELTAFKNATAKRSKAMRSIAGRAKYVWGMTGTPCAKGPEDAHGQVLLINPTKVPRSAMRWREMTMTRLSQFRWAPKPDAMDKVWAAMQPAVRFLRKDVIDLPPMQFVRREAVMSPTQAATYKTVLEKLRAQVADGEVNVANEGVKMNKLLQIASGFVYVDDGIPSYLDPKPRLDVIVEVLQEAQAKFLVFCPFTAGVDIIHAHLNKAGYPVEKVDGRTSLAKRNEIFERFRTDASMPGIVAHPGTMSHGLTLVEADMIVWAAPVASLETYEQANARISRPGQTRSQLVVQVCGSPVERRVYRRLDDRASMQNTLLEMFSDETANPTE